MLWASWRRHRDVAEATDRTGGDLFRQLRPLRHRSVSRALGLISRECLFCEIRIFRMRRNAENINLVQHRRLCVVASAYSQAPCFEPGGDRPEVKASQSFEKSYLAYTLSSRWTNLYEKRSSSCDRRRGLCSVCATRPTSTALRTRGDNTW